MSIHFSNGPLIIYFHLAVFFSLFCFSLAYSITIYLLFCLNRCWFSVRLQYLRTVRQLYEDYSYLVYGSIMWHLFRPPAALLSIDLSYVVLVALAKTACRPHESEYDCSMLSFGENSYYKPGK